MSCLGMADDKKKREGRPRGRKGLRRVKAPCGCAQFWKLTRESISSLKRVGLKGIDETKGTVAPKKTRRLTQGKKTGGTSSSLRNHSLWGDFLGHKEGLNLKAGVEPGTKRDYIPATNVTVPIRRTGEKRTSRRVQNSGRGGLVGPRAFQKKGGIGSPRGKREGKHSIKQVETNNHTDEKNRRTFVEPRRVGDPSQPPLREGGTGRHSLQKKWGHASTGTQRGLKKNRDMGTTLAERNSGGGYFCLREELENGIGSGLSEERGSFMVD